MKHEILLEETETPEQFLSLLYLRYPYDIEEKMVTTLLEKDTFPHPALLQFIAYYADFPKYRMANEISNPIDALCAKMSFLYQQNKSTLHTYVFRFDAILNIQSFQIKSPYAHLCLAQIPFLTQVNLQTLPTLTMDHAYHEATIEKSKQFLYKDISIDAKNYVAISIQINDKHGFIYVPKNQIGVAIGITLLYEVVEPSTEVDFIVLYGLSSHEDSYAYYFDETNQIYTGLVSGIRYHHFIYVMKMITTLYNAICIDKNDLPVHACMLIPQLDGKKYGIVIMGDDHSGKSEVSEMIRAFCELHHIPCTCVFEDCGTFHFLDNDLSATGMQIGACVSIHGFDKQRIFHKMPGCAFLKCNHEITHILFPFTSFKETCQFHKVHAFYYLNHKKKGEGIRKIENLEEAKQLFIAEDQRVEKKACSYFCNRLGCEQQKKQVKILIDQYFNVMMINDIQLGELCIHHFHHKRKQYIQQLFNIWRQRAKDI